MGMITSHRSTTGLIEKYIGTSYDHVKRVADSIEAVEDLSKLIHEGVDLELLAVVLQNLGDSVKDLALLATADLVAISDDLLKGNYLGNRKIDIDLTLNNASESEEVTYSGATIVTNQGITVEIPFETTEVGGNTVVEELSSYSAIYYRILNGIQNYNSNEPNEQLHIVNYEMDVINSTLPHLPTMIRIRDTDGQACNIDRITLHVYSGNAKEVRPTYFWANTTSALQTIANRVGDIIALGNDIESIILLASQRDEIKYFYDNRVNIMESPKGLFPNMEKVVALHAELEKLLNLESALDNITVVEAYANDITTVAENIAAVVAAQTHALNAANAASAAASSRDLAANSANVASQQAAIATARSDEIKGVAVGSTITGDPGTNANVVYNPYTGKFTFTIPRGNTGAKGDPFVINSIGVMSGRATYDSQPTGFSFLATDVGEIYFKLSNTTGDWSTGVPFGKGDQGDAGVGIQNIMFTSTTDSSNEAGKLNAVDTYTIFLTDGSTSTFSVRNGTSYDPALVFDDNQAVLVKGWSSLKISNELSTKAPRFTRTVSNGSKTLAPWEACTFTSTGVATLPLNPSQFVEVIISVGNFNNLIINRNGQRIMGLEANMTVDVVNQSFKLVYIDSNLGWRISA